MQIYKKLFLLIALLLSFSYSNATVYGLFYGANHNGLHCSENDIIDLTKLYRDKGAQIIRIIGTGVNRQNVITYLKRQAAACKEEDMLVFAYSGHGCNQGIACKNEFIYYSEIISIFNTSKACRKVIFTGACESGGIKDYVKNIHLPSNGHFIAMASSRKSELAYEEEGAYRSYFYNRIIEGLNGMADANNDKIVTAKELFNYVEKTVRQDVDWMEDGEHPTAYGRFSDNLRLMSCQ